MSRILHITFFLLLLVAGDISLKACQIDSFTVAQPTCRYTSDGSLTIHASGAAGFSYSIDGGNTFQGSNVFTGLSAGVYNIVVEAPLPCSVSVTVTISASSFLSASLNVTPQSLFVNDIVSVNNNSFGATATYLSFGDGTDTVNIPAVAHTYGVPGTDTLMLIASDANCVDTAYSIIQISGVSSLMLPNVFSPNEDDVNDLWIPQAFGMKEMEVTIMNRYGEIMKNWTGDEGYWDGYTFPAGVACPEGTYFYFLTATGYDGVTYNEKGIITLLR